MLKQITLLTALLSLATGLTAATISFSPSSQSVAQGDAVNVDITVSGLTANQVIGGFDLTVLSDSSIVTNTGVTFASALGTPSLELTSSSFGVGTASASEVSFEDSATLDGLQSSPPFSIFRLTYTATGVGTSTLGFALTPRDLSDGAGNLIASTALTFGTGSITVTGTGSGVPEPAAFLLSSLGLGFAALLRCRQQRA
jgi:hypothetical protein